MSEHRLKVQAPYFDALLDGSKTFEVRRNDRAYQRGDTLILTEWVGTDGDLWETARSLTFTISTVYSGDPRWGGIEPGYVILGLSPAPVGEST